MGPFPPGDVPPGVVSEMVARRRRGERVVAIAASLGVSHQWVSKATSPFGPYPPSVGRGPSEEVVHRWVDQRRAGMSVAQVAAAAGVGLHVVERATSRSGPFPWPRCAGPGLVWQRQIAKECGVATQTVSKWTARSDFPAAVGVTSSGYPAWAEDDVRAWADRYLTSCEVCGARVLGINRHVGAVHKEAPPRPRASRAHGCVSPTRHSS